MENLKNPPRRVLINSIDHNTVGAYYDTVTGLNMLSFKKYGINIPYVAAAFKGGKSCTNNGAVGSLEIELSNEAPCSECNWQYGISIVKKVQLPGVGNNETNFHATSYNNVIAAITTTGGYIDDKWLLQAEDDLISQIFNDEGLHNNNNDPITGGGAIVSAVRSYGITIPLAATNVLNFTLSGVTTAITLNTGATAITMCADLNNNATFSAHALAIATSASTINIVGLDGEDLFTIADGGGATTITVNYRRIWLRALSSKVQFSVKYDLGFATTYKKYMFVLDGAASTASATAGKTIWINGVAHNLPDLATTTLETAAINAIGTAHGVYATNVGNVNDGYIYINGDSTVDSLLVSLSTSPGANPTVYVDPTYLVLVSAATATGSFPTMTGEYVKKLFANGGDSGALGAYDVYEQADPTANYCMFYFKIDTSVFAIHGASYVDSIRTDIEVYIKSSLLATHFLYPIVNGAAISGQLSSLNAAPSTTATMDFEQLLQAWAGTGTIAQATGIVTGGTNPNAWTN